MLVLTNTLQRTFGVAYNPNQITPVGESAGFDFTRSQDLFIHGIVQGTGGTCVSMPVLYVAVGRRLGYPLKLVTTAEHSFLRWEDNETGERFNIEGTSRGYGRETDDHYRTWPRPWSSAERERGNYLESLTPREELSVFLTTRADCLFFLRRFPEAHQMYKKAVELSPRNYPARFWLARTEQLLGNVRALQRAEEIILRQQRRGTPGMEQVRIPQATPNSVRPVPSARRHPNRGVRP